MGLNGFPNLNPTHIGFGHIAHHIAGPDGDAIGKSHGTAQRVDLRNGVALVLLHILRNEIQVIIHPEDAGFTVDGLIITDLHLDPGHRRLLGRKHDLLQKQIAVGAPEVFHLKAFDLDFLDQPFVERIQRVEDVDQIMLNRMGCRIVQAEQWLESFQCFLGHSAAHLLGLVQNDDGPVGRNHINGPAGCKFVPLGIDDASLLALAVLFQRRCKSLGVDDHDLNAGTSGEVVQLIQILAVVDEKPGLLAVILHEMVRRDFETLFHAFPDGNGGHHHNELAPAVGLV